MERWKTRTRRALALFLAVLMCAGMLNLTAFAGDVEEDVEEEPCAHDWGDWEETEAPTCEADGEESRTCGLCGGEQTRPIPGGHDWQVKEETEEGTWYVCEVCGDDKFVEKEDFSSYEENTLLDEERNGTVEDEGEDDLLETRPRLRTLRTLANEENIAPLADEPVTTAEALAEAVKKGGTVTLGNDIDANITIPAGVTVTLDLNGYTLNGKTVSKAPALTNKGTVTIIDSSEAKTGCIKREDTASAGSYYTVANEGEMTIAGGYITNNSGDGTNGSSLVINLNYQNDKNYGANNGIVMHIAGGKLEQQNFVALKADPNTTMDISGGEIISGSTATNFYGNVNISGGEVSFKGDILVLSHKNNSVEGEYAGGLSITGGTVSCGNIQVLNGWSGGMTKSAPALSITGGDVTVQKILRGQKNAEGKVSTNVNNGVASVTLSDSASIHSENVAPIATVGGKNYLSLQDAVNSAKDGDKIVMLRDSESNKRVEVGVYQETEGKHIILDLAGHTIQHNGTGNWAYGIFLQGKSKLTVQDSSGNGLIKGVPANGKWSAGISIWDDAELIVEGGTIQGSAYGITGNGSKVDGTNAASRLTITGGTVIATSEKGTGIFHPDPSRVVLGKASDPSSKPVIKGGATGIEMRAGELEIYNAEIRGAEQRSAFESAPSGSGTTALGAGLAIVQHTTKNAIKVTIHNADIQGIKAIYEENLQKNSAEDVAKIVLDIQDGKFTGDVESEDPKNFISGGTFSSDVNAYVVKGKQANEGSSGTWTIGPATGENYVAQVDGVSYETLQEAITACPADGIVQVLADVSLTSAINPGKAITIEGVSKADGTKPVISGDEGLFSFTKASATIKNLNLQATGNTWYIYHSAGEQTGEVKLTVSECEFTMAEGVTNVGNLIMTEGTKTKTPVIFTDNKVVAHSRAAFSGPGDNTVITGNEIDLISEHYDTSRTSVIGLTATANTGNVIITGNTFKNANRVLGVDNAPNMPADKLTFNENRIIDCRWAFELAGDDARTFDINYNYYNFNNTVSAPRIEDAKGEAGHFADGNAYTGSAVTNNIHYTTEALEKSLTVANASVRVGRTVQLTAASSTLSGPVTWTSLTPGIATVDNNGLVTGVAQGSANIRATIGVFSANCTVSVTGSSTSSGGGGGSYRPSSRPSNGGTVNIEDPDVPLAQAFPFTDVAESSWYFENVKYVHEKGLMTGITDTNFAPNNTTTRGMIVTILYRLEGSPAVETPASFTDVSPDQYYADPVAWASANSIVNGYDESTFKPETPITREQMAAILYRYAAFKGYSVTARADLTAYTDAVDVSAYAAEAMQWANAAALISGSDGRLLPQGDAVRAQVAAILNRFCEQAAK